VRLAHPGRYSFVSANSPIKPPQPLPLGRERLQSLLGPIAPAGVAWDACELIASARSGLPLLIDQGLDDPFPAESAAGPQDLVRGAHAAGHPLTAEAPALA